MKYIRVQHMLFKSEATVWKSKEYHYVGSLTDNLFSKSPYPKCYSSLIFAPRKRTD